MKCGNRVQFIYKDILKGNYKTDRLTDFTALKFRYKKKCNEHFLLNILNKTK